MATKMLRDNPELSIDNMSSTNCYRCINTWFISSWRLFVNQDDTILLPEHNWGELQTCFQYKKWCKPSNISIFDKDGHYTTDSLVEALQSYNKDKVIMILNYPNNPTGYTPTHKEVTTIVEAIKSIS